jgi:hypothetical protein
MFISAKANVNEYRRLHLPGHFAVSMGITSSKFQDSILVPSSRDKTFNKPMMCWNIPKHQRSELHSGKSLNFYERIHFNFLCFHTNMLTQKKKIGVNRHSSNWNTYFLNTPHAFILIYWQTFTVTLCFIPSDVYNVSL